MSGFLGGEQLPNKEQDFLAVKSAFIANQYKTKILYFVV